MDDLTWTVVQFLEDLTVEAIPTSWIQGEYCHWPPYKQEKLISAIKKCEPLNTNWPRHEIKIFRNGTFDEYAKARLKARMAEDCSDLNSGNESTAGKRKRIQKILSSSSSDDSIGSPCKLPPPPKLPRSLNSSHFKGMLFNPSQTNFENCSNISINDFETAQSSQEPTPRVKKNTKDSTSDTTNKKQTAGSSSCCLQHENNVLIEIKNQNHMIRNILVDVLNEIKELKKSKLETHTTKSIFVKYLNIKFPIGTNPEMSRFEEELQNEENFTEAVNELAKFGGSNPYNFIKRTMSALIKDIVLINYSWLGRKGKKPLQKSPVGKLLIWAADKCVGSTQKEIEGAIQSYLKRCGERLKATENKKM